MKKQYQYDLGDGYELKRKTDSLSDVRSNSDYKDPWLEQTEESFTNFHHELHDSGESHYWHITKNKKSIGKINVSHTGSVSLSGIDRNHMGQGLGRKAYVALSDHYGILSSDTSRTDSADKAWEAIGSIKYNGRYHTSDLIRAHVENPKSKKHLNALITDKDHSVKFQDHSKFQATISKQFLDNTPSKNLYKFINHPVFNKSHFNRMVDNFSDEDLYKVAKSPYLTSDHIHRAPIKELWWFANHPAFNESHVDKIPNSDLTNIASNPKVKKRHIDSMPDHHLHRAMDNPEFNEEHFQRMISEKHFQELPPERKDNFFSRWNQIKQNRSLAKSKQYEFNTHTRKWRIK